MNIVRAILLTLLSLNFSSELLHATGKNNVMTLEDKKMASDKAVTGRELEETKAVGCSWWDNRGC